MSPQQIENLRVVEWTSRFTRGAPVVEYELQYRRSGQENWEKPGTYPTLEKARTALLLFVRSNDASDLAIIIALRRGFRDAADFALFLSDEVEMGRLPTTDGASALRMFAGLLSLIEKLT